MDKLEEKKIEAINHLYGIFLKKMRELKKYQDEVLDKFEAEIERKEIETIKNSLRNIGTV